MYTAPLNGFKNSNDYCEKSSSKQFIATVKIPTLLVNAKNDPFLSDSCYPIKECKNHEFVTLEIPKEGGHISFAQNGGIYYSEQRAMDFFLKEA
jgi:predicted alpha/beta-fold hydrolase